MTQRLILYVFILSFMNIVSHDPGHVIIIFTYFQLFLVNFVPKSRKKGTRTQSPPPSLSEILYPPLEVY